MSVGIRPPQSQTDYAGLIERVVALVRATTPSGASVLMVSRGDGRLVDLPGWDVGHFPQSPTGLYAGHYPADGRGAIDHLKKLRAHGAQYLMVPATGLWWLDHYNEFGDWLAAKASVVADEPGTGRLFSLVSEGDAGTGGASSSAARTAPQ